MIFTFEINRRLYLKPDGTINGAAQMQATTEGQNHLLLDDVYRECGEQSRQPAWNLLHLLRRTCCLAP